MTKFRSDYIRNVSIDNKLFEFNCEYYFEVLFKKKQTIIYNYNRFINLQKNLEN